MSPKLFNLYQDDAVRHRQLELKIQNISDNLKQETFIETFMSADDQVKTL
jgi:hypothetical protein